MDFTNLWTEIKAAQIIIICRHIHPDPDALGSQGGLATLLSQAFPDKRVLCFGSMPKDLQYLNQMDRVKEEDFQDALLITTDTANLDRLDGKDFLPLAKKVLKIDHHPNEDHYADEEWVDTKASSTSEIIYDFYHQFKEELTLTPKVAYLLYAGIVGDTGRFLFNNTTSHTFEVVSELVKQPFDVAKLNRQFIEKERKVLKLEGYLLDHFTCTKEGVGYFYITNELIEQFGLEHEDTASCVGLMGNAKEVKVWALFLEKKAHPGNYRCRLRSKELPIVEVAKAHEGGGHPLASGANAYSLEETEAIIEELKAVVKEK